MRPITLKLQAFGSYGKETVIDFTKPAQNLFLITGDTGSGKTTIFDAMVYALYGEVSSAGNKKDGLELQSQFGNMEETPLVELTFSEIINGDKNIFIVNRSPRYKRRKKIGEGYTEVSGTVSLILPDGSEYPQKEANKKIQEIVGLTKDQFMQVAMIAQGEFMELLRASSDTKKKIFQKLFNTSFYQKIVDELGIRRKNLEKNLDAFHNKSQVVVGSVTVPEGYIDKNEVENLVQKIGEDKKGNSILLEELLPALDKLLVWQRRHHKEAAEEKKNIQEVRDQARDNCTDAKNLLISFQQLEEAQNALELLDKKTQNMEKQFILCQQLKLAYDLRQLWEPYKDAKTVVINTKNLFEKQKEQLPALQKELKNAQTKKDEIEKERDVALEVYTQQKEKCDQSIETFKSIARKEKDIEEKRIAFATAEGKEKTASQALVDLKQQEVHWKETQENLEDAPILLGQWNSKWKECEQAKNSVDKIGNLEEQYEESKDAVKRKHENYENAKETYRQKRNTYDKETQKFLDNQAGYIAKTYLKKGEACPVCGSLDHPFPCIMKETGILDREEIEELKRQLDKALNNQEKAAVEAREQQWAVESLEKSKKDEIQDLQKTLEKHLGSLGDMKTAKSFASVVDPWKEKLEKEGIQIKKDDKKLKEAKVFLANLDFEKEALQKSFEEAAKEREEKKQNLEVVKGQLEQLKSQKIFATREDAQAALQKAEIKKQKADERATVINETVTKLKGEVATCEAVLQECRNNLPAQKAKSDALLEKYESKLRKPVLLKEVFTKNTPSQISLNQEEWMHLVELHDKDEIERIEEDLANYRQEKNTAETKKSTAAANIKGKEKPDIEILTNKYNESDTRLFLAEDKEAAVKKEVDNNNKAYQELQALMKDSGQIREEHSLVNGMYARLSGNMTGSRMDIETFVQRYYLEHILDAANVRFEEMSAGQFQLQMMSVEEAAIGKNKGLDLMVYSMVTGKKRPVGTLSGGESFMAALSLALGMADEITRRSAAINLDVMFIDEGFGSLDDHSRSQAVKVLRQMAGGTRLVGIISHVSELKQEIEDQLLVTKDDEGSHSRWQLS